MRSACLVEGGRRAEGIRVREEFLAAVLLMFLVGGLSEPASAAPGDPDATFGTDGRTITGISPFDDGARSIGLQADGRIIVAGIGRDNAGRPVYPLTRYTSGGIPDPSFGNAGVVFLPFDRPIGSEEAPALAIQSDGKIVVAATGNHPGFFQDVMLVRYDPDGNLDRGFGIDGLIRTDIAGGDHARAVAILDDGRIMVAAESDEGILYQALFALIRYQVDGALDPSWGKGGIVLTDFAVGPESVSDLAVLPDGKVLALGTLNGNQYALARYLHDGTLDSAFGTGGKVMTPISTRYNAYDQARALAVQADGKIIVAGDTWYNTERFGTHYDITLARFHADGSQDRFFGAEGRVFTDLGGGTDDRAYALRLQSDGRILVSGSTRQFSPISRRMQEDMVLLRYLPDGRPDETFGEGGRVITDLGNGEEDMARALGLQADGRILLAGEVRRAESGRDLVLARFLSEATDTTSPVTEAVLSTDPNPMGWHRSDVLVSFAATDDPGGAGVQEIRIRLNHQPEEVLPGNTALASFTEDGIHTLRYFAVDQAGNAEEAKVLIVRIDRTPPSITSTQDPPANAAGWNRSEVTVSFQAEDLLSGGVSCTRLSTRLQSEGAEQPVQTICTDAAGNQALATRRVSIDHTPPHLSHSGLEGPFPIGSNVTIHYDGDDPLSGLETISATLNGIAVLSGSIRRLDRPGEYTFDIRGMDRAGNLSVATLTFTVDGRLGRFLSPLKDDRLTTHRLGRVLPVKFALWDLQGNPVPDARIRLSVEKIAGPGMTDGTDQNGPSRVLDDFLEEQGGHYAFRLDTRSLSTGVWAIRVTLDNGTDYSRLIALK